MRALCFIASIAVLIAVALIAFFALEIAVQAVGAVRVVA